MDATSSDDEGSFSVNSSNNSNSSPSDGNSSSAGDDRSSEGGDPSSEGGDQSSDSGDQSSDADDERIGEDWRVEKLRSMRHVTIDIDPLQRKLLSSAEGEWQTVLARLNQNIKDKGHFDFTVEAVLDVMLSEFVDFVHETVTKGDVKKDANIVTRSQLISFFRVELMAARYQMTPTVLYRDNVVGPVVEAILTKSLYERIQNIFEDLPVHSPEYSVVKRDLEMLLADTCRFCFDRNSTIGVDDDDKYSSDSSRSSQRFEFETDTMTKSVEPVVHRVYSALTSLFICSTTKLLGESDVYCIDSCLEKLARAKKEDVKLCNLFIRDRNCNTKAVSNNCLELGLHELGTVDEDGRFIFTFGKKPAGAQRKIPVEGTFGAYFAKRTSNIPGRKVTLHGVAVRECGRTVLLTTSKSEFGNFKFHFESSTPTKKWVIELKQRPGPASSFNSQKEKVQVHLDAFQERVIQITENQQDPAWLLMSKFHITANVSSKFIALWKGCQVDEDNENINRLRNYMKVVGYDTASNVEYLSTEHRQRWRNLLTQSTLSELRDLCKFYATLYPEQLTLATTGSKPQLIEMLLNLGFNPDVNVAMDMLKSMDRILLEAWFVSPSDLPSLCNDGFDESHILDNLGTFIEDYSDFKLLCLRKYGLVANKSVPWLATSVDGLLFLQDTTTQVHPVIGEWRKLVPGSTECSKANSLREAYPPFNRVKVELDHIENQSLLNNLVPDCLHNLVHHCATLGIEKVLYVVSTVQGIVYAVLIEFGQMLLDVYKSVCVGVLEPHVSPFHKLPGNSKMCTIQPMLGKLNGIFGEAVDEDTFVLTVAMWRNLIERVMGSNKPLPACRTIRPAMESAWTLLRSGVDEHRRLLMNCLPQHRTNAICESQLFSNTFFTLIANCHLLYRAHSVVFESKTKLHRRFKSYNHFRFHLSNVGSMRDFCESAAVAMESLAVPSATSAVNSSVARPTIGKLHNKRKVREDFESRALELILGNVEHLLCPIQRQVRCIVCCEKCRVNGQGELIKHHADSAKKCRQGYKTKFGCRACFVSLTKKRLRGRSNFRPEEHPGIVALCNKKRFLHLGDDRTCFEIHHQCNGAYPTCAPHSSEV